MNSMIQAPKLSVGSALTLFKGIVPLVIAVAPVVVAAADQVVSPIPDFQQSNETSPFELNDSEDEAIDSHLGALRLAYTDMEIPGNAGFNLKVVRSYSSSRLKSGGHADMGPYTPKPLGWAVHFGRIYAMNRRCEDGGTSINYAPLLETPDGNRRWGMFTDSANLPKMMTQDRWSISCSGSGYVAIAPDGTRFDMQKVTTLGWVECSIGGQCAVVAYDTTRISDTKGNYADVTYNNIADPNDERAAYAVPAAIVANDGRRIDFEYNYKAGGDNPQPIPFPTRITGPGGATVTYTLGDLSTVQNVYNYRTIALNSVSIKPGLTWSYVYHRPRYLSDPRCGFNIDCEPETWGLFLKTVTEPFGGTREYTWTNVPTVRGTGTVGVLKKAHSDGGIWSYSYSVDKSNSRQPKTITTITTPGARKIYHHLVDRSSGLGKSQTTPDWHASLPIHVEVVGLQTETFVWEGQPMSDSWTSHVDQDAQIDGKRYLSVLKRHTTIRDGAKTEEVNDGFDIVGRPSIVTKTGAPGQPRRTIERVYNQNSKWMLDLIESERVTEQ
jgi:hypothetical protein